MKTPNVGDVVTAIVQGECTRGKIRKSYKRRFIIVVKGWSELMLNTERPRDLGIVVGQIVAEEALLIAYTFERADEGKTWVRGWDDETAIAFRAEKALAACR